jgi:cytochrome c553
MKTLNNKRILCPAVILCMAASAVAAAELQHTSAMEKAATMAGDLCGACHGPAGMSGEEGTPHLAGQREEYLAAQLRNFRSGTRGSEVMNPIAHGLSDLEISALSKHFATLKPGPAPQALPGHAHAHGHGGMVHGVKEGEEHKGLSRN